MLGMRELQDRKEPSWSILRAQCRSLIILTYWTGLDLEASCELHEMWPTRHYLHAAKIGETLRDRSIGMFLHSPGYDMFFSIFKGL